MVAIRKLSPLTQSILSDVAFDIEFQGYLSNHAKHGVIAQGRLGASDERIKEWWDQYTTLTPYSIPLERVDTSSKVTPCSKQEFFENKGKKKDWRRMCAFLQKELDETSIPMSQLVKIYAPDLLDGIAGALTHGIIHLGWALDAENQWMVIEGLAYLNYCHLGVDPEKLQENAIQESSPTQSLKRITSTWKKEDLANKWVEAAKEKYDESFHPELVPAGFQWQLAKVMKEANPLATKLPSWLSEMDLPELWEHMYRTVVSMYLATRSREGDGNFLVLHAITSLWGLEHVCQTIDNESTTRKALGYYWASLICLLAAGCFPETARVENVLSEFPLTATDSEAFSWEEIKALGRAEEEEHNIKLVYVCSELWSRYGQWKGFSEAARSFTLTPDVKPAFNR